VDTGASPDDKAPEEQAPEAQATDAQASDAQGPRGLRDRLRASRLGGIAAVAAENLRDPSRGFALVLLASLILRGLWLNVPASGLIFDEAYYVNAARIIDGLPAGAHYAGSPLGLDPNTEHPPLGKLVIAASMSVFGDQGLGWRLPSIVAGLVALVVLFEIMRRTDRSAWFAVLVVALVSFDNLTFVHGRIGTLDMLVLAPMLVGSLLALRRRWVLAGIAVGIALLVKLTAIYAVLAIGLWLVLTDGPEWWRRRRVPLRELAGPLAFLGMSAGVFLVGLAVLDARFTTFTTPFDHISRMLSYGTALRAPATSVGICPEADSKPWQWLFNECQIQYLRVDVTTHAGDQVVSKVASIDFRGALNPLLAGAIPLASLFMAWYAAKTRNAAAIWALTWAAANYLPYVALALVTNRIMYLYYMVQVVPALGVAVAILLLRAGLPRPVRWGFVLAYAVGFIAYFPFRQIPT
jgi:predicted membrane-bound dolichyl-phosphate-mannose-protein mannosyltransferase